MIIRDTDCNLFVIMALKIKNEKYIRRFAIGAKLPIEIGCNVKRCPACGSVLSFAYNRYFCRECGYSARQS